MAYRLDDSSVSTPGAVVSETCSLLHRLVAERRRFEPPFGDPRMPTHGVYFIFEAGEPGHGVDRIVRIGTHTGSRSVLADRLREHFINANKDRSIFRKNIGRALLNKASDPFLVDWDKDLTTRSSRALHCHEINLAKQEAVEKQVTEYMLSAFQVTSIACAPDGRRSLEANLISTVANCRECVASASWLGRYSPLALIRDTGLWQVQGVQRPIPLDWDAQALKIAFSEETVG